MDASGAKAKKWPTCPHCGNRLRLRADQVGSEVKCPKCNAVFTVGKPAAAPARPVAPEDAYEPEIPLKRSTIVHEPAPTMIEIEPLPPAEDVPIVAHYVPKVVGDQYEADWRGDNLEFEAPHERPPGVEPDYLEMAHERGLVRARDEQAAPDWLFFSGVFSFPWRGVNAARWTAMAAAMMLTGEIFFVLVKEMSGAVSFAGPILVLVTSGMTLVTLTLSGACFMAAVDDTVEGQDDVQDATFPPLDEWLPSLFRLLNVGLASGAAGYPLTLVPQIGPVAIPVSAAILFPVLMLSAMECDSFLLPLSPIVWRTMARFPGTWLAFYLISSLLVGGWLAGTLIGLPAAPFPAVLVSGAALAAIVLIYARLLGRLGRRISTESAADDAASGAPRRRRMSRKRKKRGITVEIPDKLALPGDFPADQPTAPRLDFHRRP